MTSRWQEITPSQFPWEREALAYVREGLPDHEPYHAWSNFEFIADDGTVNEVDLLVVTPSGFFMVEIKSRPGKLDGDNSTWTSTGVLTAGNRFVDMSFFDVTNAQAGDTYIVSVSNGAPRISGFSFDVVVPEPASVALLSLAFVGLIGVSRSRRK